MTGKAIYALLSANATVLAAVSTRIFPDVATQDAAYPFIVYTIAATDPTDTKEGPSTLDTVTAVVTTFATSYTSAVDISAAARTALDRKTGTYEGVSIQSVRFADQRSLEMEWDKHVYMIEQVYAIRQNR